MPGSPFCSCPTQKFQIELNINQPMASIINQNVWWKTRLVPFNNKVYLPHVLWVLTPSILCFSSESHTWPPFRTTVGGSPLHFKGNGTCCKKNLNKKQIHYTNEKIKDSKGFKDSFMKEDDNLSWIWLFPEICPIDWKLMLFQNAPCCP